MALVAMEDHEIYYDSIAEPQLAVLVIAAVPVSSPRAKTSDLLGAPTIRHLLQPLPNNLNQTLHTDGR